MELPRRHRTWVFFSDVTFRKYTCRVELLTVASVEKAKLVTCYTDTAKAEWISILSFSMLKYCTKVNNKCAAFKDALAWF